MSITLLGHPLHLSAILPEHRNICGTSFQLYTPLVGQGGNAGHWDLPQGGLQLGNLILLEYEIRLADAVGDAAVA